MSPIIKSPKKIVETETIIYNPMVKISRESTLEILAIRHQKDHLIRIDFLYHASPIYVNGGWVQMSPDCFIRPINTTQKYKLVKAENIPIAPTKHYFKSSRDILSYSLYFPAMPENTTSIDIIEDESHGQNWFNFYGVSMQTVRTRRLKVMNN